MAIAKEQLRQIIAENDINSKRQTIRLGINI